MCLWDRVLTGCYCSYVFDSVCLWDCVLTGCYCSDVCDSVCLWDRVLTGCYCFASHIIAYHLTGERKFNNLIAGQKQLYLNRTDNCCCLREHTYTP